jgi:hypothetical protein
MAPTDVPISKLNFHYMRAAKDFSCTPPLNNCIYCYFFETPRRRPAGSRDSMLS